MSSASSIEREIGRLESVIDRLLDEVRNLRGDVQDLSKLIGVKLGEVSSELARTRLDLSARLLLVSTTLSLTSYITAVARLEALKKFSAELNKRVPEIVRMYREKILEILQDYLSAAKHFFGQFVRRAELDFQLMREAINLEKTVSEFYKRLSPEYVDAELVSLVVDEDTERRAHAIKEIASRLEEARTLLEEASMLRHNFQQMLERYSFRGIPSEENTILLVPVLKAEAQLNGVFESRIIAPSEDWEKETKLTKSLQSYASSVPTWEDIEITQDNIAEAKKILLNLAKSPDEKDLIEKMSIGVL
ncbi:hypothetical protein [Infirmifilum sp.]|uniref:hypothetical protein n=1 Tax=Infirmifilum sp. TaxID=2856575 RepID=UPI003D0D0305